MNADKIKEIEALLNSNDEAAEKIAGSESLDDVVAILAEYGIETTNEEFVEFAKQFSNGELSEDILELVAGGGKVRDFIWGVCDGINDGWNNTKKFFCGLFS